MTTAHADPHLNDLARHPGVVALIGISPKPDRPSYSVAQYLMSQGVNVYLVNPVVAGQTVLGRTVLARLADVPEPIHIVDVFRRAEFVPEVVAEAIAAHADALWLQLDIFNDAAVAQARAAGLTVVVNRCLAVEHRRVAHD